MDIKWLEDFVALSKSRRTNRRGFSLAPVSTSDSITDVRPPLASTVRQPVSALSASTTVSVPSISPVLSRTVMFVWSPIRRTSTTSASRSSS